LLSEGSAGCVPRLSQSNEPGWEEVLRRSQKLETRDPQTSKAVQGDENKMMKSKKRFSVLLMAATLLVAGAAGFAQRHFMLTNAARPEVKMQLSAAVERDSALVALDKTTVVNPGEILDWTITSENSGNAAALEYKTVGHIPPGTTFVADSAKADGAKAGYSIDNGKSWSAQPMIEVKQADGSIKRVPAPVAMYTEIRYEWADPLAQGGKLSASYKVRVK
jgi:uncharacterized repeat protein (TIGR01451 family)